jgi:EAL domain-containing protein (putative c-di-GMP-specific phosphodiesterase class I)/CheY-like chemotaxis protein
LLFVDDDPLVCRAYSDALGRAGYDVSTALNVRGALDCLHAKTPDCIVSDIAMPGADGLELLRSVRETDLDLPVILMTGYPDVETAAKAAEYGAFRYLRKPVEIACLLTAIGKAARMLRMARLRREAYVYLRRIGLPVGDRAGLEAHFQSALSQLWLAFQPIVDWSARRVVGYEALVRSGDEVLSDPRALLDAAQRLERLDELGQVIRRAVSKVVRGVPDDVDFFVNLHGHDLTDDGLFLPSAPLSTVAKRVVLEVTERASLDGVGNLRQRVARLRDLGYRIAVDNLGAGYAGLTAFAQLEPDIVKLDMALTRDIHVEPIKRTLVESITGICDQMEVSVIAEGVESEAERDALASAGCRLFQGYLFAKPAREFPDVAGFAQGRGAGRGGGGG